ncbi:MAG: ATP-grasp domain-containing protein, partial [Treponema sp.]|nr:ATP-grasp domain-containing protein [Treponema sp.]
MKIVLYSTASNLFDGNTFLIKQLPSCASTINDFLEKNRDIEIDIVTQLPGMFLIDLDKNILKEKAFNVNYHILPLESSLDDIATEIENCNPDIAVSASFWTAPYDWLTAKDSLIASMLEKKNIKTICHTMETSLTCFDKWETHNFLIRNGFNVAKAVLVRHDMFFNAASKKEINENIYQECILKQIEELHYPVIIKDTSGLSSYGMEVMETFEKTKKYLLSKRNNSDRIVEEYIKGMQFGAEIYGINGNYRVVPPFLFSVNKYGITSPKQSIKIGPVVDEKYNISLLISELERMANIFNFRGITQIDLVYKDNLWYIIEINPRISGMTSSYAISLSSSIIELLINSFLKKNDFIDYKEMHKTMNIKFPLLNETELIRLKSKPFVKYIRQMENLAAKQDRETGYCECIIQGKDWKEIESEL